jgi:hypothetical protein
MSLTQASFSIELSILLSCDTVFRLLLFPPARFDKVPLT